jgi:threonine synthase
LPISRLIIATNVNDILVRSLETGCYEVRDVTPTISPAMDIQVPSNFERLLLEACNRDAKQVSGLMSRLAKSGKFKLPAQALATLRHQFDSVRTNEQATRETIASTFGATGLLVDPHTAVGIAAAGVRHSGPDEIMICLSTAHPAKFSDAIELATGRCATLPSHLEDLEKRSERFVRLANDLSMVKDHISQNSRAQR